MLNTSDWPEKKLDVMNELHLDPRNVRLENTDPKVEADILEDLFVNENALALVEGICTVGYLSHDVPVAIKRGQKYVMVEGNRRLAALKAIQNPQLVPTHRAQVAALAKRLDDRARLAKIRVMLAPNQVEVDQLVAAIHTGNPRKAWSPTRQAAFFQAQIDSGRKLRTLLARYPTVDVKRFVFRAHMLNAFRSAKFKDPALRDYLATKEWRGLSVLARLFESRDFLELTGFKMDEDGKLSKSISKKAFNEMASIIVDGMRTGDLTTRSLNKIRSPRFVRLMDELRAVVNPPPLSAPSGQRPQPASESKKGTGRGLGGSKGDNSGRQNGTDSGSDTRSSHLGQKKPYLDLGLIILPDVYPTALKICVQELSALDIQRFPNAAFLLMRAVLEKTIKAFAEEKGVEIKDSGNNERGRVQLGHALKWLLQYTQKNGPTSMIDPIQRVRDDKVFMRSSRSLNAVNHNHHFGVAPDEAFSMWDAIDPIMRLVIKA